MKIEEIIKRLIDTDKNISYFQRLAIADAIRKMEADKIESSKVIISLIDNGECDDLGFSTEEIYNKYLGERSERD